MYPKFCPLIYQDISYKDLQWLKFAQASTRSNNLLNTDASIRVLVCTKAVGFIMFQMNFMDHYGPSGLLLSSFKSWIMIFQESHSNYQKGKIGKIRVLTENDRTLIFDLIPDLLVGSMISRIRALHFDLIAYFNSSSKISGLIDKIRSTGGKSQLCTK